MAGLLCCLGALAMSGCAGDQAKVSSGSLPVNHTLPGMTRPDPKGVSVFPIPGSRYSLPRTQITLRGIAPGEIGELKVVGSMTGPHQGQIEADSDRRGGSFMPSQPFAPGETVRVKTHLKVLGARHGRFSFTIAHPTGRFSPGPLSIAQMVAGGVQRFRSRPGLAPATIALDRNSAPRSGGDIFLAPQNGPLQDGPMILDSRGGLIWFHPTSVRKRLLTTDFRAQRLHGRRVLTWWQGSTNRGSGRGVGMIYNCHYRRVATVHAGNGQDVDLHEFLITPEGHAYVIAASPVWLPGLTRPLIDSVVQEIDIKTGLVLFDWHSLDHVALPESYKYQPNLPGHVVDPYHMNSISINRDGDLIISMRNTSAIYKLDHRTGKIIWRLGGKASSFRMGPGTVTGFQHAAEVHRDGTLTIFDNGAGPPKVHPYSRGIRVVLDTASMTATLVKSYDHSPTVSSNFEGGVQRLAGGQTFLGYGQKPYFTQFDSSGQEDLDGHFITANSSYRAYRFRWSGRPAAQPAVSASRSGAAMIVFASWNGATGVARWRVLGGSTRGSLHALAEAGKRGFETSVTTRAGRYVAVQALGAKGRVLATSATVRAH
jgi:outer membrane protein assembly factor BamB